jgi:putative CocE/NonD family hydrolase
MARADSAAPRSFPGRPELARDGYIYVAEDIRGRYKSEGQFIMSRPLADHKDPKAIDESTDASDTVAWLLANVSGNNGRAGFIGTSYPGFLAMMAGIDPHPAVKAISPQAPMIDAWMGDDFFHNGAFRQSYGYDYVLRMESSKEEIMKLRQGQGWHPPRRLRFLSGARQLRPGREAVWLQNPAHLEALPFASRL